VLAREYTLPCTSVYFRRYIRPGAGEKHTSGDACSVQLPGYVLPARSEETILGNIFTKIYSRGFFMEQGGNKWNPEINHQKFVEHLYFIQKLLLEV
jgi:hypothetical protein